MFQYAVLNGSLWAVGSAWSTSIRAIVLELLPGSQISIIAAELLATFITTLLAVSLSFLVTRVKPRPTRPTDRPPPLPFVALRSRTAATTSRRV